jgi:hypothetical protein
MMLMPSLGLHPLPTSPIEGEVPLHSYGPIQSQPPAFTSPLMGEAGRGWGREYTSLQPCEVQS